MGINGIHHMLGQTILGIALIGVIVALFARDPNGGARRAAAVFSRLFAVVLSIQWILGLIVFLSRASFSFAALAHPIIMTVVVALAHIVSGRVNKDRRFGYGPLLGMMVLMLVAIYFGIGAV